MSYLLDLVRLSLDDVSIEKISGHIGQDPITTTEAIDSALPMLMGALSRSAKGDGATSLHEALKKDHDGRILDDIPRHVRSGDRNDGQKILGHVLGSHQEISKDENKATKINVYVYLFINGEIIHSSSS